MSNNHSAGPVPSRRTVVKGAAWAVPAVVVASAAPAYALSGPLNPTYLPGTFCKHPSASYYHAVFCFDNTTTEDIVVTLDTMSVTNVADTTPTAAEIFTAYFNKGEPETLQKSYTIPAGEELCLYVDAGLTGSSSNGYAILTGSYVYGGETTAFSVKAGKYISTSEGLDPCGTGTGSASTQPKDGPPHTSDGPTVP